MEFDIEIDFTDLAFLMFGYYDESMTWVTIDTYTIGKNRGTYEIPFLAVGNIDLSTLSGKGEVSWVKVNSVEHDDDARVPSGSDGERFYKVSITVDDNVTSASREGGINIAFSNSITAKKGSSRLQINQTTDAQGEETAYFKTDKEIIYANKKGESGTITYTYNDIVATSITVSSDSSWINTELGGGNILYSFEVNGTSQARSGSIYLRGKSTTTNNLISLNIQVIQESVDNEVIFKLDKYDIAIPSGATRANVGYSYSNVKKFSFHSNNDWIVVDPYVQDKHVFFDVLENDGWNRHGSITFEYEGNDGSKGVVNLNIMQEYGVYMFGFIKVITPNIVFNTWKAVSGRVEFYYYEIVVEAVHSTNDKIVITDSGMTDNHGYIDFKIDANNTDGTNEGLITIVAQEQIQMTEIVGGAYIVQQASPTIEYSPIWKDTFIELEGEGKWVDYQLTDEKYDRLFYSGRAYFINNQVKIRINEIVRNHLEETMKIEEGLHDNTAYIDVIVSLSSDSGRSWEDLKRYRFFNDWSYEKPSKYIITNPIRKEYDTRQYVMCSFCDYDGQNPLITKELMSSRRSAQGAIVHVTQIDIADNIITDCLLGARARRLTYSVGDMESVVFPRLDDSCNRYCIYYQNLRGGFDWFIFKGKCIESFAMVDNQYKRNIDNNFTTHEKVTYQKNITKSWSLTTDYLSDNESKMFREIYLSPMVWLHDLQEGKVYPINITNKNFETKSYKNQGRKLFTYNVKCELAQDRMVK